MYIYFALLLPVFVFLAFELVQALRCYQWYRKLRGGYWVYWHFVEWKKVNKETYARVWLQRGHPFLGLEDYTRGKD